MDQQKRSNRVITFIGITLSAVLIVMAVFFVRSFLSSKVHVITTDFYREDNLYTMEGFNLPEGNYIISMEYVLTGEAGKASLSYEQPTGDIDLPLPVNDGTGEPVFFSFPLGNPISNGRVSVSVPEGSEFSLSRMTLYSDRYMFSDGIAYAVLCMIAVAGIWLMIRSIRKGSDPVHIAVAVALFIITTVPCIARHSQSVGIDLRAHLMRLDGIYLGLKDGQFPAVIFPEWSNRHGQLGVLYPSFFVYPFALLRMARVSLYATLRIMIIAINAVSSYVFYKVTISTFNSRLSRVLALILISLDYYRMFSLSYGGMLLGALLAEIFIPVFIAGLIDVLYKDGKHWYYLAIGMAGILCTHTLSIVVVLITSLIFVLFVIRSLKQKRIWINIGKAAALSVPLFLGSYVAFFRYYFIDWSDAELKWHDFFEDMWKLSRPFSDELWNYPLILLLVCLAVFVITKVTDKGKEREKSPAYVFPMLATALILFYMTTIYFPWALLRKIDVIKDLTDLLQSTNRFLGLIGTLCAFCLPVMLESLYKDTEKWRKITYIVVYSSVTLFAIAGLKHAMSLYLHTYLRINDELVAPVDFDYEDFLPSGTISEYYQSDAGIISDDSVVDTLEYTRSGTKIRYRYTSSSEGQFVEFPLFYYDGYKAYDEAGSPLAIGKSDRNKLLMDLDKTSEAKEINIKYSVPVYVSFFYAFSAFAWIIFIVALPFKNAVTASKEK